MFKTRMEILINACVNRRICSANDTVDIWKSPPEIALACVITRRLVKKHDSRVPRLRSNIRLRNLQIGSETIIRWWGGTVSIRWTLLNFVGDIHCVLVIRNSQYYTARNESDLNTETFKENIIYCYRERMTVKIKNSNLLLIDVGNRNNFWTFKMCLSLVVISKIYIICFVWRFNVL